MAFETKAPWLKNYGDVRFHLDYFDGSMWEAVRNIAHKYPDYIPPSGVFSMTLNLSETALLSMVIPRSCSSSLLSKYLILPAIRVDMMLFAARRASIIVVLPWST